MAAHTKEPWHQKGAQVRDPNEMIVARCTNNTDAASIVADHTACAGIENPAAIPEAVEALRFARCWMHGYQDEITRSAPEGDEKRFYVALGNIDKALDALNGRR